MADLSNENISDLMDNEWDDAKAGGSVDALVHAIAHSAEARDKWARYHLMRDVMQNEFTTVLDNDFASRVSSAIEAEPAIVAFPAGSREQVPGDGVITADKQNVDLIEPEFGADSQIEKGSGWKRYATGFAIAASVAMVSVVGLNLWRGDDATQSQNTVASNSNQLPTSPSVGAEQLQLVANRGTYWVDKSAGALSQQNAERLNMFLSQHIENAPTVHSGMFPYSRLAGYDNLRPQTSTPEQ